MRSRSGIIKDYRRSSVPISSGMTQISLSSIGLVTSSPKNFSPGWGRIFRCSYPYMERRWSRSSFPRQKLGPDLHGRRAQIRSNQIQSPGDQAQLANRSGNASRAATLNWLMAWCLQQCSHILYVTACMSSSALRPT